ncbi:MAG: PAS domain S-box protein [Acidobacteriia bacterium]|nr:PAS domain S-box protein [Terriglobia bacterium]
MTSRLDTLLAYAESHRVWVCGVAALMIAAVAWIDWISPDVSLGILYVFPLLLSAAALSGLQILAMAAICGYLREVFDPLQGATEITGAALWRAFDPANWVSGSYGRLAVAVAGFAMTGFFAAELNQRRRLLSAHLKQVEEQIRRRQEAELQVRILVETSPLAILTLDSAGQVVLYNDSARQLLGFESEPLAGEAVTPYLPILKRILNSHHSGGNIRTSVECKGQRRNGEVFLAHVWLSTYRSSDGPGIAAVVWDSSEHLRDREASGVDSMMATSRVVIGAMSHEIRNLASAASSAYAALANIAGVTGSEQYQALGSLVLGLEKIASSGLRAASHPGRAVANLGAVLDEARIVIEPSLRESGIAVSWEAPGPLPLVQGDHQSLLQVFVNLARNSERAMENSSRRELRVSATVENDLVVVRFRDTGPGVAHPEELFKPFQPGSHSTGLGLYISRAILRSHGGSLRHEPQPAGSCFAVELWPAEDEGQKP